MGCSPRRASSRSKGCGTNASGPQFSSQTAWHPSYANIYRMQPYICSDLGSVELRSEHHDRAEHGLLPQAVTSSLPEKRNLAKHEVTCRDMDLEPRVWGQSLGGCGFSRFPQSLAQKVGSRPPRAGQAATYSRAKLKGDCCQPSPRSWAHMVTPRTKPSLGFDSASFGLHLALAAFGFFESQALLSRLSRRCNLRLPP